MTTQAAHLPANGLGSDKVLVHVFAVGHGDCTLIEYLQSGAVAYRLLCDAGASLPQALIAHLRHHPRPIGVPDIDLAILSHVDADHQGGFHALFGDHSIAVGEYWGPCLPAFRRHAWLFAPRVAAAVQRATELERLLSKRAIPVTYPLEGYTSTVVGGRVTLSVFSPPPRLLRRLLGAGADGVRDLLTSSPMPLEWLVADGPPVDEGDEQGTLTALFAGRSFLLPNDFPNDPPRAHGLGMDEVHGIAAERLGQSWEPDFFGNSVLNDTSLVVAMDIRLEGTVRRRILLTGDQENWAYIASQYPAGLGVDLLKAPHHGGRVYLADRRESAEYAMEQMYLWLRPRTVLVSAQGLHGLPHVRFRESLRAVGSALVCPNTRGFEPLTSGAQASDSKSCFAAYACDGTPQRPHTVVAIERDRESVDAPTCGQGSLHRGAAPVVVLSQRVVEPDEAFVRWTRTEVEKHTEWVRRKLGERHNEFGHAVGDSSTPLMASMGQLPFAWEDLKATAKAEGRHQFAAEPSTVLRFGVSRRRFWVQGSPGDYGGRCGLCRASTEGEVAGLRTWLRSLPSILLHAKGLDRSLSGAADRLRLLREADLTPLVAVAAAKLRIPFAFAQEEIQPVLMSDMATQFSARWCDADRPHGPPSGSRKFDAFIHLWRGAPSTPDVFSEEWKKSLWWEHVLKEETFKFLLEQASSAMFVACAFNYSQGSEPRLQSELLAKFDRYHGIYNKPSPEEFPVGFASARWEPLWRATSDSDDCSV